MATGPDLRIGDAEREAAAASLREHYARGRLTLGEFNERLDAVFAATTQRQLSQLTRDLPHLSGVASPQPLTAAAGGQGRDGREQWSGSQPPPRFRLGLFPVILAAVAAWLVVADLHLRVFPWPGKVAIFLAILAVIRGLMRRVFGLGRGRVYRGCCRRSRRF